jgi:Putative adhesin
MGKRELLLVVAFLIAGAVVYQITAPPPAPGERSFSPGQLVEDFRRHLRGNHASAETTTTTHHPVDAAVAELKVTRTGELTIIGENRTDIEAELHVRSNGFDEAEAQRLAQETVLKMEGDGSRLVATISYPEAGTQRALQLTLKVPARLMVILEASGSPLNVTGVAGVELNSRGEARLRNITGRVTGTYRGGELFVADSKSIKLTTQGTEVHFERISGETTLNIRSGELKASELAGPIEIESQGADITLEKVQKATGVLRINASSGSVNVRDLQTEARIEVRGSEVDVVADRAAPLSIYSEGGGSIEVTPAAGGYQLDAVAKSGDITMPQNTLQTTNSGEEHRAAGAVLGGGPTITIRSGGADITIRQH